MKTLSETSNQPKIKIKQPPVLFSKTQSIIEKLTSLLKAPFIAFWNNPRGSIYDGDVIALYEILEKLGKQETVYLFVKSDGGRGQESLRIVNLLRQYCNNLVALVPLECASAATMITLGANKILMGPTAFLTAVDTSLNHPLSPIDRDNDRVNVSLDELTRVIRLWKDHEGEASDNPYKSLYQYIHPLVIGAVDRAESLSIMLCRELLAYHISDIDVSHQIAKTLNSKYPSHNYPILLPEAKSIGLQVEPLNSEINKILLTLNELYSEMGQKATTDFDEIHAHGNEILNIWETTNLQLYFQQDKEWFYRSEERRWIAMNDNSSWRRIERTGRSIKKSIKHVA